MELHEAAAARYPAAEHGRCATCGFYGQAVASPVSEPAPGLQEISGPYRKAGRMPATNRFSGPACLREAADLYEEVKQAADARSPAPPEVVFIPRDPETLLAITGRDRRCPDWYGYQPGLDPKEHLDQMHMIQLEQARHEHQVALAKLQADSQASLEAVTKTTQAIQAEIRDLAKETKSFTTVWTYVAVSIAALALLAAGAAAGFTALTYFGVKP